MTICCSTPKAPPFVVALLASTVLTWGLVGSAGAQEASENAPACRGLEQADCELQAHCSWVAAYQRRDGIEVRGHCRTRSGQRRTTEQPPESDPSAPDAEPESATDAEPEAEAMAPEESLTDQP